MTSKPSKLCLLILTVLTMSFANTANTADNYPGGIAELLIEKLGDELPEVKYGLREPVILDIGEHWRVLIGLELETLPGSYVAYIKRALPDSTAYAEKFQVEQKIYPIHEYVTEDPIELHHEQLSELDFSNSAEPRLPLSLPVDTAGQWQDNFGHLYQNTETQQLIVQNYIKLETTALATVMAPQNALVTKITTNEQQLSTLYLDHGRGLYSIISGVRDLSVSVGNGVVAGAVLGKLAGVINNDQPSSLYWQCVLNGALINPLLLVKLQP